MSAERVVIGNAELWLGDCMEVLPNLQRVTHVITDPPYEQEAHSHGRRALGKQEGGDRSVEMLPLDFEPMTADLRAHVSSAAAGLCDGWFLTFCQAEAVALWRAAHEAAGAKYLRAMVWIKPDGAPQFTGDRPGMGYESIVASWCGARRSAWNGGGRHGVFTHPNRENNSPKEHMTQKPIGLMRELVGLFSGHGETILDPFMGSGTTGVAAVGMGRQFVGVEQEARHFETACRRIEEAQKQVALFPHVPQPKQEQSGMFTEAAT